MVCAIHSKTNMIYITFIILYIITIEEVYCDVKDVNDICLSNIKNDLDNCSDADDCAQKLFNTNKDYDKLQLHTQKYALFLYSDMAVGYKDFLVSLNEDCKHNIRAKGYPKTLDDPIFETYQKCVDDNKSFGFWHRYAHRSVEQVFFGSKNRQSGESSVKLNEEYLNRVNAVKTKFFTEIGKTNWIGNKEPASFCSISCVDQISSVFHGCKTAKECALFAYQYLEKTELNRFHRNMSNDHALRYMEYLYKNIEVSEEIINDGTKQIMPLTSILMSPRNYCIILSDQLMSNTLFDSRQWASRILACYDDMVEYGVDLYLLKERTTSILTAFQKLQKNEGNSGKGKKNTVGKLFSTKSLNTVTSYLSRTTSLSTKMTEKAKRTNSQSIKDFTFDQRNYNFLRKELRPNEDSNKGYFGHVFFNISLTYIDRASDAYNYVQRLMDFSNLNALDSTVLTPDAFCEKKPAYVSNFNYEEAKQKLEEEYDNHTRNMSKDRLRRFEAGRLNESKDSEHKNDT